MPAARRPLGSVVAVQGAPEVMAVGAAPALERVPPARFLARSNEGAAEAHPRPPDLAA